MCVHYMYCKQVCCAKQKPKRMVIDTTHSSHDNASFMLLFPHIKHIQYEYMQNLFSVNKKQQLEENIYFALRDCKIKRTTHSSCHTQNEIKISIYDHVIRYLMNIHKIAHRDDLPDTILVTLDMPLIQLLNAHVPIEHENGVVRIHRHEENIIKGDTKEQ